MTVIQESPALGGQSYPFLKGLDWTITTTPIGNKGHNEEARQKAKENFEKVRKDTHVSLRWVKSDKISDLRIGNFPTYQQTLKMLGLELSMAKGGFVLSKRISRLMRPYYFYGFFDHVNIRYDAALDKKRWDGSGLISRAFLNALTSHAPDEKKHRLLSCGRVNFTIQSARGQDKGHALVVDDLDVDMVLPLDSKAEVKLTTGQIFVGVQPVLSKDTSWFDVQSMINLRPFLRTEHLLKWLRDMGDQFLRDIEDGSLDEIMSRLVSLRDVDHWPVGTFLMSGGHAMWFSSIVKHLSEQLVKKVKARSLKKLRTPVPGGYYYVFVDEIGHREIPKGQIELDSAHATAWISREDWDEASRILGGADQDDALWVLPFRDWDGELKVLIWRSPNQLGEYMVFAPKEDIAWAQWPELDSRQLPTRIDQRSTRYENLVEETEHPNLAYSIRNMNATITAAKRNLGTIGQSVNLQMALKALTDDLPDTLPARLEEIVDAEVKTGANLSAVKTWNRRYAQTYFMQHMKVPAALKHRITGFLTPEQREWIEPTTDHWLDDLISQVQTYLHEFKAQRDALRQRCMPPIAVFEYGRDYAKQGGLLKTAYFTALGGNDALLKAEDFERARAASEAVLMRFPTASWKRIMAGAALRAYVYGDDAGSTSDACLWQYGKLNEDKTRARGITHLTLRMLVECGVLSELVETRQGTVKYYRREAEVGQPIAVYGPWFSAAQAIQERQGQPVAVEMADVKVGDRAYFKGLVSDWAEQGLFNGQTLYIREDEWKGKPRKSVWRNDKRLGFLKEAHESRVKDTLIPKFSLAEDGNLLVIGV